MRILYVEDNPANLSLVQRVARIGNHNVISYMNGTSALENFERDNPDLVLMDIQLPGSLTGLDVVRRLRARGYQTPIIAVTAYAMVGDRERCLEAGCDDYMAKPLPVADLIAMFNRYDKQPASITPPPTPSTPPQPGSDGIEDLPARFIAATPAPADNPPPQPVSSASISPAASSNGDSPKPSPVSEDAPPKPAAEAAAPESPAEDTVPKPAAQDTKPVSEDTPKPATDETPPKPLSDEKP